MNHKEILKKHIWWRVDVDKAYWYQCVDWIRMYSNYLWREITTRWSAFELWNKWLWSRWKKIKKTTFNFPSEGDIVIWDTTWGWWYWHIAICNRFCNALVLRTVDQNWWDGSWNWLWKNAISPFFRSYKWVIGWYTYLK